MRGGNTGSMESAGTDDGAEGFGKAARLVKSDLSGMS